MENGARRFQTSGGFEETIMSASGPSATTDETSNFHTAQVEECYCNYLSCSDEVAFDNDRSSAGSSATEGPKSEYFSIRVEEMMQSRSEFSSAVEHEIAHSRVHWSEVSDLSEFSKEDDDNDDDYEEVNRENEEVFRELMNNPQWKHIEWGEFFLKLPPIWKLGRKIAEGGQAEIFEVMQVRENFGVKRFVDTVDPVMLFKVFKRGARLSDLQKQWPCGIFRREVRCIAIYGLMLDDGRFAFVMNKCWGDLRKLIDQAMQEKNNRGPPFPYMWSGRVLHAKDVMRQIAYHMDSLHKQGIIHRELKAANILLMANDIKGHSLIVADFECSIGVVGWRAPEILLALKNRSTINFSDKVNVYSYAMICFEIVTGHLPFEGELEVCRASNDLVIEGWRPKLPSDLDVILKDLIERCWNPTPYERPSFSQILEEFVS